MIKQMAAITALAGNGLTKAAGDTADLFVGYQIAVDQERQWNAYGGGGLRWGGRMGSATKTLNPSDNPGKNQDRLNKAMAKLLKDFPPKAKK